MEASKGLIVRAKAGRDSNGFFVITQVCDDGYVFIADGKRRKIEKPKRKNIKHLALTRSIINVSGLTNAGLRKELAKFEPKSE